MRHRLFKPTPVQVTSAVENVTVFYPTSLREQLNNLGLADGFVSTECLGLESQQQDEEERKKNIAEDYEELLAMVNPTHKTGSVHVYLLDEEGLANGHHGSHAALTALVRASMANQGKVLAALTSDPARASHGVLGERKRIREYLASAGIQTLDGMDGVREYLQSLPVPEDAEPIFQVTQDSNL